jgi:hypothetical protein
MDEIKYKRLEDLESKQKSEGQNRQRVVRYDGTVESAKVFKIIDS